MHSRSRRLSPVGHAGAQRQRGAALIVAMLVFALSAAIVVALQTDFYRYFQRTSNLLLAEQSRAYLRGAEDLAALVLQQDYDQDTQNQRNRDDLQEFWAQQSQPLPLDDIGWLKAEPLQDLQGRYNLNWLYEPGVKLPQGKRFTAAQQQFIRLLQALPDIEMSEYEAIAITESIADWLDPDSNVRAEGAEDDFYASQTPTYRAANQPMMSVSELRAISNITPQLYNVLQYHVTVWPQQPEPLNIHTASAVLLRTINGNDILSPLDEADGESLYQQREEEGFSDIQALRDHAIFKGKDLSDVSGLLGENSSYFLLHAWVELADRNMHLYSVLERKNRRTQAVARAGGGQFTSAL